MSIWFFLLTVVFIVVSTIMVLMILVQRPQGGGLAGAFGGAGGGGTDTVFGGRTGDVLTLSTIAAFVVFLILSVALNILDNRPTDAAAVTPGEGVNSTLDFPMPEGVTVTPAPGTIGEPVMLEPMTPPAADTTLTPPPAEQPTTP